MKPARKPSIPKRAARRISTAIITARIERQIHLIRGERVLLDSDLAALYGVTTKRFNEQIRRNAARFPADFMFQLHADEAETLRSQIATSKPGRGGRRYLALAFTEHGAIMAATILNSPRAIEISVYVVRAFVQLRIVIASNKAIARKVAELERRLGTHDEAIANLVQAIRQLMAPPAVKRRGIGFVLDDE
jgi:ORF6N domain